MIGRKATFTWRPVVKSGPKTAADVKMYELFVYKSGPEEDGENVHVEGEGRRGNVKTSGGMPVQVRERVRVLLYREGSGRARQTRTFRVSVCDRSLKNVWSSMLCLCCVFVFVLFVFGVEGDARNTSNGSRTSSRRIRSRVIVKRIA